MTTQGPVPCSLIAAHVAGAFTSTDQASKAEVIRHAQLQGGPHEVLVALLSLPDRRYRSVRDVCTALPGAAVSDG